MADEHHRHLARLQPGYDGEEPLDFALGQGRRRLVHDQHLGVDRKGAGNLHELLLGWAQPLQDVLRAARQPDDPQQTRSSFAHGLIVDAKRAAGHMSDEDILEHR